jgi:hypothetical protein
MNSLPSLDWIGCALGLLGATLLASKTAASPLGWIAYLTSNVAWIAYGVLTAQHSIVIMQSGFTLTTLLGLYRHRAELFAPRGERGRLGRRRGQAQPGAAA